ncbi:hypothetical protein [Cytobacillus firmus]|uniref:hypothetical protein n=1 Tax=Cytobacillus firmus TaxID=1399 RepID=UPI0018CED882|nr:hypothetical protein [Cytobacillus firmus]MBG9444647.1 hypothetical protein [Cytobacillus firmus]
MQLGQYQREHEELTRFIQNLVGDRTLVVSKISHGNHSSQVHIHIRKQLNESTTTDSFPLFLELGTIIPSGMNVYNPVIIQDIKKNLSKETIHSAFPKWFQ